MADRNKYENAYGMWEVTTEGDCEGKSVRRLGVYKGYIDEIAFALADQCYYSLEFAPFDFSEIPVPKSVRDRVNINFDIGSGTWDMSADARKEFFSAVLSDRKVAVGEGSSYAAVTLYRSESDMIENKKKAALNKLSEEDKVLLGLIQ